MNEERGFVLSPRALRELRQADVATQRRILEALERLVESPQSVDVKKLEGGPDEWRLRVGDWRVRFRRDAQNVIVVTRVLPRSRAYR
jgi:mRNA interferase RelE/StbE